MAKVCACILQSVGARAHTHTHCASLCVCVWWTPPCIGAPAAEATTLSVSVGVHLGGEAALPGAAVLLLDPTAKEEPRWRPRRASGGLATPQRRARAEPHLAAPQQRRRIGAP